MQNRRRRNCAFAAYGNAFSLIEMPNDIGYKRVPHLLVTRYLHLGFPEKLFIPLLTNLCGTVALFCLQKYPKIRYFPKQKTTTPPKMAG